MCHRWDRPLVWRRGRGPHLPGSCPPPAPSALPLPPFSDFKTPPIVKGSMYHIRAAMLPSSCCARAHFLCALLLG
eukprot:3477167-Pyramimonas_sp.AAC.1